MLLGTMIMSGPANISITRRYLLTAGLMLIMILSAIPMLVSAQDAVPANTASTKAAGPTDDTGLQSDSDIVPGTEGQGMSPSNTTAGLSTLPAHSMRYIPGPGVSLAPRAINSRVTGDKKPFVLCIDFLDIAYTKPITQYATMLTNMDDYFNEVSYDHLNISGTTATKWYRSSYDMQYYGADSGVSHDSLNGPIYELVKEAVIKANTDVDFSTLDYDGDGKVDNIIVVHAGNDQAESDVGNDIWSHKSAIPGGYTVDGVKVEDYTMLAENSPLGTFVHEFSHDLGLPDLYDYGMDSDGVGIWDLMGMGNVLNNGLSPGHISAWGKIQLGWMQPTVVDDILFDQNIPPIERNPVAYKLKISDKEYFLVENRQQIDADSNLFGRGLLICHVDENQYSTDPGNNKHWQPNEDENHKFIDVEEHSHTQDLDIGITESDYNVGDATDAWYGTDAGFSFYSDPKSTSYALSVTDTGIYVTNISALGATSYDMTATLGVTKRAVSQSCLNSTSLALTTKQSASLFFDAHSNRKAGDVFVIEKTGTNRDWALPNVTSVGVPGPSGTGKYKLTITVPSTALEGDSASIVVKLKNVEGYYTNAITVSVVVQARFELGFSEVQPQTFHSLQDTSIPVTIYNRGNFKVDLDLTLDKLNSFQASVTPPTLNISAMASTTVTVVLRPLQDAAGGQEFEFTLTAKLVTDPTKTNSTTLSGTVLVQRGLGLSVIGAMGPLTLGETTDIPLNLSNLGNLGEEITLSYAIEDPDNAVGWSLDFEASVVSLASLRSKSVTLSVTTALDTVYLDSGTKVTLSAMSKDSTVTKALSLSLFVQKVYNVELRRADDKFTYPMDPDAKMDMGVRITNYGNIYDNMALTVNKVEGFLLTLAKSAVYLAPYQELTVNISCRSDFDLAVGDYNLTFTATSQSNASYIQSLVFRISIKPSCKTSVSLSNPQQDSEGCTHFMPGDKLTFTLTVQNVGNFIDTIRLSSNMSKGMGSVKFYDESDKSINQLELGINEKRTIKVVVSIKSDTTVAKKDLDIIVTNYQNKEYRASVNLVSDDTGGISAAAVIIIVIVVILLLMLCAVGVLLFLVKKGKIKLPGKTQDDKNLGKTKGDKDHGKNPGVNTPGKAQGDKK